MYFPISGIEVNPFWPPLVAFVISLFTSMGGVSGAFLLLPFQVSVLGFNTPSVSATNQLYNIVAIPSGVYRYIREGRMVWPLTLVVIIGTLPGVFIGAFVRIQYLPNPRNFKLFIGLVLLYIGVRLVSDLMKKRGQNLPSVEDQFRERVKEYQNKQNTSQILPKTIVKRLSLSRIVYEFYGEEFDVNALGIFSLSFIVGIIGGAYGIGGGSIIAPFFVSFFGLPIYTVAGAALMGTFITSIAGVLFYQLIAPFYPGISISPDWALGLLFGLGGFAGMYCGARLQKFVSANIIKLILVGCILLTAGNYFIEFII